MTDDRISRDSTIQPKTMSAAQTVQTTAHGEGVEQHDGTEDERDAEEDVGEPREDRVDQAAVVAGQ